MGRGRPLETDLRRATSTVYYALFHRLAKCCADSVVGRKAAETNRAEWRRVYRALDHVAARRACTDPAIATFPENVRGIAQLFVESQNRRHDADHDPHGDWFKSEVIDRIATARQAIRDFEDADLRDKRAFAVHLLFGGGS